MNYLVLAFIILGFLVILFVVIALIRAFRFGKAKVDKVELVALPKMDSEKLSAHLSDTIQCETLSNLDAEKVDSAIFEALHVVLKKNYPLIYEKLERVSKKLEASPRHDSSSKAQEFSISYPSPGMELNLRGERAEDAVEILIPYIEKAFLAGLPFVRIIHGKGSGRLREVVRQQLNRSSHIRNWEEAKQSEGGSGVTVVKIKAS